MAPRGAQEGKHEPTIRAFRPKRPPGGPLALEAPRGLKEAQKDAPRAPQTAPKRPPKHRVKSGIAK
eukprot:7546821-Pyramimonas_sp.AAC.1